MSDFVFEFFFECGLESAGAAGEGGASGKAAVFVELRGRLLATQPTAATHCEEVEVEVEEEAEEVVVRDERS